MARTKSTFLGLLAVLLSPMAANADLIRENLAGTFTSATGGYWGQSVTTGAGTSWYDLEFNFYSGDTAIAWGDLYLLSSEYLGPVAGLSGLGTVLGVAGNSGGIWSFDAATTIFANTTYWFYAESALSGSLTGNTSSGVVGEGHYAGTAATPNFDGPFKGINYTLTGTVSVPEPGTLALLGIGLFGIALARRKKA